MHEMVRLLGRTGGGQGGISSISDGLCSVPSLPSRYSQILLLPPPRPFISVSRNGSTYSLVGSCVWVCVCVLGSTRYRKEEVDGR